MGEMLMPQYYHFRVDAITESYILAICEQLGLDSDSRGAWSKALRFALRVTAVGLVCPGNYAAHCRAVESAQRESE